MSNQSVDAQLASDLLPLPYYIQTANANDASELASMLSHWQQNYEQLSAGEFVGSLFEALFSDIQIFSESTSQVVSESCHSWDGSLAFGIPIQMEGTGWIHGMELNDKSIVILKNGCDVLFRTPKKLEILSVGLPMQQLMDYAIDIEGVDITNALNNLDNISILRPEQAPHIGQFIRTIYLCLQATPELLTHQETRKALRNAILSHLVSIFGNFDGAKAVSRTMLEHQKLVSKASEYMSEHIDEPLGVTDLCLALGVSRRTLQYCFENVLQLSPASYLKTKRLNGVRKELIKNGAAHVNIQDVAAKWGFWHFSRFASDYRALFGELPSMTIKLKYS